MSDVCFRAIEAIANHIHEAHMRRRALRLDPDQVALLDEWMQAELELAADSEWLARAVASDDRSSFVSLEQAKKELSTPDTDHGV